MSVVIACPVCTQKVRAPEKVLGRQIKCPQCKNGFIALDPNAPPTSPDFAPEFAGAEASESRADLDDRIDEVEEPAVPVKPNTFVDYLLLRRMVTPVIVVVVFYGGGVLQLLAATYVLVTGVVELMRGWAFLGVLTILGAMVGTVVSLILWRIFCEVLIALFRILDNVREINEQLKDRG